MVFGIIDDTHLTLPQLYAGTEHHPPIALLPPPSEPELLTDGRTASNRILHMSTGLEVTDITPCRDGQLQYSQYAYP
jgi:hypothetical protein